MAARRRQPRRSRKGIALGALLLLLLGSLFANEIRRHPELAAVAAVVVIAPAVWKMIAGRRRRRQRRIGAETLADFLALSPLRFELAVGQLLEALGWSEVRQLGGSGDLAADISAVDPDGRRVVVQCKRFAAGQTVGSPVVQTVLAMATIHHRADRAMVVTTSSFTLPARTLAQQHRVELVDGKRLVEMAHYAHDWQRPVLTF